MKNILVQKFKYRPWNSKKKLNQLQHAKKFYIIKQNLRKITYIRKKIKRIISKKYIKLCSKKRKLRYRRKNKKIFLHKLKRKKYRWRRRVYLFLRHKRSRFYRKKFLIMRPRRRKLRILKKNYLRWIIKRRRYNIRKWPLAKKKNKYFRIFNWRRTRTPFYNQKIKWEFGNKLILRKILQQSHFLPKLHQFKKNVLKVKNSNFSRRNKLLTQFEWRVCRYLWRIGIFQTWTSLKTLIQHGFIFINNKRTHNPAYLLKVGDKITFDIILWGNILRSRLIRTTLKFPKFSLISARRSCAILFIRLPKQKDYRRSRFIKNYNKRVLV